VSKREAETADLPDNRPGENEATARGWRPDPSLLSKIAVGIAVVAWAYWPNLRELVRRWSEDPDNSHGYLVIPVAVAILLRPREKAKEDDARPEKAKAKAKKEDDAPPEPSWWGWLLVVAALVARAVFYELGKNWLETATILAVIAGLTLSLGGWRLLGRAWPAIAYLGFMLPLPPGLNNLLSLPLQRLATQASCRLLRLTGIWTIAEGNVLDVSGNRLEVATACSGLSMFMMLAATISAMVLLVPLVPWRRVVLLASIIPVALISNVLRITATGWCYYLFGPGRGAHFAHDWAGYLMMPMALVLVGLEMLLLSWFFVEVEEEEDTSRGLGPLLAVRTKPAAAQAGPAGFPEGADDRKASGSVGVEDAIR
jgi:exosortase